MTITAPTPTINGYRRTQATNLIGFLGDARPGDFWTTTDDDTAVTYVTVSAADTPQGDRRSLTLAALRTTATPGGGHDHAIAVMDGDWKRHTKTNAVTAAARVRRTWTPLNVPARHDHNDLASAHEAALVFMGGHEGLVAEWFPTSVPLMFATILVDRSVVLAGSPARGKDAARAVLLAQHFLDASEAGDDVFDREGGDEAKTLADVAAADVEGDPRGADARRRFLDWARARRLEESYLLDVDVHLH